MIDPIFSAHELFLREHKRKSEERWPYRGGRWLNGPTRKVRNF